MIAKTAKISYFFFDFVSFLKSEQIG
jgi:hypothetical protein